MHLKIILIFCALCFFTDTMSKGLNAIQIQCLQILVKNYNDKEIVNKVINAFNVDKEYNYNHNDTEHKRVYDILHFMHTFDKAGDKIILTGDEHPIIKLDINELKIVFDHISDIGLKDNGCVVEEEKFHTLIDLFGFSGLINDDDTLAVWKTNIKEDYKYDLSEVLIELLGYQAQLYKWKFGKIEDLKIFDEFIKYALMDHTSDQIKPKLVLLLNN
ncbi:uncharacterized protein LOC126905992 [Daktulosphaira vitifoliae]|uniref:uncharacterized protein LOC126905992 n=1 Tax=Daktulosphaira vitifoliae TaxID=58002 RepID=UPI0021AAC214|nr:uncharacterized protein LOC126905992 [Daktulosphaira vitifoliae]